MRGMVLKLSTLAMVTLISCSIVCRISAQTADQDPVCAQALAHPLTPPSFPSPMKETQLKNCDSQALYYGFDRPPDFAAALQCAFYQRAHPDPTVGDPFAGPGVLTMLYANGKGVKRDYDLAIRFACENTWAAPAEMSSRIAHLLKMRATHSVTSKFDLCDDATSGLMEGACESVSQDFADAKRQQELKTIERAWPAEVQQSFKTLQKAEADFEEARVQNEVDLSGTGRAAFELQDQGRLRAQFVINLKRFAKGDIPHASSADAEAVDRKLNDVYQQIQQAPDKSWQYTTVKPSGIRKTQRVWLKLRDEWGDFAHSAFPGLDRTSVVAQLTRLRLHQLEFLLPRN